MTVPGKAPSEIQISKVGLLVVRDLAASWFLISRKQSKEKTDSRVIELIAYFSSGFPFIYLSAHYSLPQAGLISSILAVICFAISTLAVFDLGGARLAYHLPIEELSALVFIDMSVTQCTPVVSFLSLVLYYLIRLFILFGKFQ